MSKKQRVASRTSAGGSNRLRIIGGRWRGRKLSFPDALGLRPTGDRLRETLFNWLQPYLAEGRCLDLFAGSGALGFEAASRAAAEVVMLEANPQVARSLAANIELLKADQVQLQNMQAEHYLQQTPTPFDLVFLDPPFAFDILPQIFALLEQGWLAEGALIYIEQPLRTQLVFPKSWQILKEKRMGEVQVWLLEVGLNAEV
ncbi:MAG: 16S rRNA (guanine(966)-N(2))-methyltransferase RsmD [Gammaproteobacteria bacterium]|nr:16S rRNA (guanine(966)-N(2))-methyltransferase RsmD [Gammaproteobacteria bacterium]